MEAGEVHQGVGGKEEVGDDGRDGVKPGCGGERKRVMKEEMRVEFIDIKINQGFKRMLKLV